MTEGRIGSFLFYLNPELRENLREQQLQAIRFGDIFDPQVLAGQAVVVVAERQVVRPGHDSTALLGVPFDRVGCYRRLPFGGVGGPLRLAEPLAVAAHLG